MSLTQFAIQKAAPRDKPYKLSDSGGLYLLIRPNARRELDLHTLDEHAIGRAKILNGQIVAYKREPRVVS